MAKRKTSAPQEPVQYLHLECTSYGESTSEPDPDDEWSRASTSTTWSVHGISVSNQDGAYAIPAGFQVNVGDLVWVVYAVYSTGDTFGHDDGAYLEVLSFHKDEDRARRNVRNLESRQSNLSKFTMIIELDNGEKMERHCSWDGYFESLDFVRTEAFFVKKSNLRP